jgi:RNA recognition motif-containing protein
MKNETTLWMGDLESWMNEPFIMSSFHKFGFYPKSIKIIKYKQNNIFKSFCYISFYSFIELNSALLTLNAKKIPNTNYYFKLNLTKYNKIHDQIIYVGNLSPMVTDLEFYFLFKSKYPSVYFASIIRDNGASRGYGFVHLGNDEEYSRCLKEMDGVVYRNKILKVKEKNNTSFCSANKCNNYFSDLLKSEEIKSFLPKPVNINIGNETIISDGSKNDSKINTSYPGKKKFSDELEMLKNNDSILLFEKINESVDKIIKYKTMLGKENEIPNILSYYYFSK